MFNLCGSFSYFILGFQKSCVFNTVMIFFFSDNWSKKAQRRKTTGTGRMRHMKIVFRKFKLVKFLFSSSFCIHSIQLVLDFFFLNFHEQSFYQAIQSHIEHIYAIRHFLGVT